METEANLLLRELEVKRSEARGLVFEMDDVAREAPELPIAW